MRGIILWLLGVPVIAIIAALQSSSRTGSREIDELLS
jgi:hypothetical protein